MATNRKLIHAPPERVFDVLSDPGSYGDWVVGSSQIRDADPGFPGLGTRFHHTQGVLGRGIRDSTRVLESRPPRRLVLRVCARPLAVGKVALQLTPVDGGTEVRMDEVAIGGLLAAVPRMLADPPTWLRNEISLSRLKRLAEGNGRR
jgi:uncharacterized protein YndB with AHSA1/START domain